MKLDFLLLSWLSRIGSAHAFQQPLVRSYVSGAKKTGFSSMSQPISSIRHRFLPVKLASSSPEAEPSDKTNYEKANNSQLEEQQKDKSSTMTDAIIRTIGSTTSLFVAGTFYSILCYRRDAFMVSFFIGAILNGILSKVLKRVLGVARPDALDSNTLDLAPSDNGMPSSHAMSLGFIGTFTALTLPQTAIPLLIYCLISLVYRVQSHLHTIEQICVGAVVGTLNGILWWKMCTEGLELGGKMLNVADWVATSSIMDPRTGLLPWYLLSVPALIGAAVVGSVERRISQYLSKRKGQKAA